MYVCIHNSRLASIVCSAMWMTVGCLVYKLASTSVSKVPTFREGVDDVTAFLH